MFSRRVTCLSTAVFMAALASSVHALEGVPSQPMLSAMGLSGIELMSDADAMAVRGFGYDPWHGYGKKSRAIAYGHSYASVNAYGAKAHSEDGFYAEGRYYASGEHGSYAVVKVKRGSKHRRGGRRGGDYNKGGGKKDGGYQGGGNKGGGRNRHKSKKVIAFAGGFSHASTD